MLIVLAEGEFLFVQKMFVLQRAPKVYKHRREDPRDQDYVKLFRFNPESVAWLSTHFLGTDSGETRGGAIDNITKMKILLRYIADPGGSSAFLCTLANIKTNMLCI